MTTRREARKAVLQALYAYEMRESQAEQLVEEFIQENKLDEKSALFVRELCLKVIENMERIDSLVKGCVEHWDFSRLAVVDKNILRLAIGEFLFFSDIPRKVSIDEAIELAKEFSSQDSGSFVNGVLDSIAKKLNRD
ncbi:MAG: transcription antitermination factor NusB [candidate division Zixibacteria bacterium]|nr:transcription antitermination factor NusB [candidate division Zixibacteria bacterium]